MIRHKFIQLLETAKKLHTVLAYQLPNSVYKVFQRFPKKISFARSFVIGAPTTAIAILGLKKNSNDAANVTAKEILLAKADALFEQSEYQGIYTMLQNYRDNKDVEILWRLSRALYNMAQTANKAEAKEMIYEGYDLISKALEIEKDNYAVHKWMAVLLDEKSSHEGLQARIKQLYNVKNHLLKASELNPQDATTIYMIGNWCYQVASLAWYQRKMVAVIFGEPPESSYEEAFKFFEKAEQVDPNFYSQNLLMLGKTCLKLNRKEDAQKYLKRASEYSARNDDDLKAKKEATKLLEGIKVS